MTRVLNTKNISKKDIKIGEIFNSWKVVDFSPGGGIICICLLCNKTIKKLRRFEVIKGKTKHCQECRPQAVKKEKKQKIIKKRAIEIKQIFNYWQVIEKRDNNKILCLCLKCNKIKKEINVYSLLDGTSKSCGCDRNKLEIGQTYKSWNLINKKEDFGWICKCTKCGTIHNRTGMQVLNVGCPTCLQKTLESKNKIKINEKIGYWKFLENPINKKEIECLCTGCNSIKKTKKYWITSGRSKSCGCMSFENRSKTNIQRIGVSCSAKLKSQRYRLQQWCEKNPEKVFISKSEREIFEWIKQYYPDVKKYKKDSNEIDIFISELNLGIELNGLYWHSEEILKRKHSSGKTYHLNKTKYFQNMNIRVIHIWENEWKDKQKQIKSYLLSAMKLNQNKVFARKCDFIWSDNKDDIKQVNKFLEDYHIQGKPHQTKYVIKIIYNNEMIGCATFGKHHRNSKDWVLSRFCIKQNYTITGGLSKLSKLACNQLKSDIISWADYRLSLGTGYEKAGWIKDTILPPDYFYQKGGRKIFSKQSRQKKSVNTPKDMTEHEHAKLDGLSRVYDCGKIRFIYKYEIKED